MAAMPFFGSRRGGRKSSNGYLWSLTGEKPLFTGVLLGPTFPLREVLLFESLETEDMLFVASITEEVLAGLATDAILFPAEQVVVGLAIFTILPAAALGESILETSTEGVIPGNLTREMLKTGDKTMSLTEDSFPLALGGY